MKTQCNPATRGSRFWRWLAIISLLLFLPVTIFGAPAPQSEELEDSPPVGQQAKLPEELPLIEKWGDRVSIFSGETHIPPNVRQRGTIIGIGGDILIEGIVDDVVAIGGSVTITGKVRNSVVTVLSSVDLTEATIGRDMINVLGGFQNESSIIHGQFFNMGLGSWFPDLWDLINWLRLLKILVIFISLVLLAALAPERIRTIGAAAPKRYVGAFFMGILGYLVLLVVLGLLSMTVVGLPLALIGFWVLKWMGIAGIFFAVGHRIGQSFGREMSVLGAIMICFVLYLVVALLPIPFGLIGLAASCFLWLLFFLLFALPGVGLVMLTRIGSQARAPVTPLSAPSHPSEGPPSATSGDSIPPATRPGPPE